MAGVQTIGIGHKLLPGESFPDGITQDQAQTMLAHDLTFVQNALTVIAPASCTQNQWDALCDFGFNLGVGALKTLLAHGWDQVPTQLLRWTTLAGWKWQDSGRAARQRLRCSLHRKGGGNC